MARDEFWDALKEHAHRNHQERVSKNPDRIAYAIQQLEAHGIEYQLKNQQTGAINSITIGKWEIRGQYNFILISSIGNLEF